MGFSLYVQSPYAEPNIDNTRSRLKHCHQCGKQLKKLYAVYGQEKWLSAYCGNKCQVANFEKLRAEFEHFLDTQYFPEPGDEVDDPKVVLFQNS